MIVPGEIPIVIADPLTVKEKIRWLCENRESLPELGRRSRQYVLDHHSLEAVGKVFEAVNRRIGLKEANA